MKKMVKFPLWCIVAATLPLILYSHELAASAEAHAPAVQKMNVEPRIYDSVGLCLHSSDECLTLARRIAGESDITFVSVCYNSMTDGTGRKETNDFSNIIGASYAILFDSGSNSMLGDCVATGSNCGLASRDNGRVAKTLLQDDPLRYVREYLETRK